MLLLERSGKYDLQEMLKHVRTSAFLLNRFRLMERISTKIQENERRTGKMSSAVLIIDLEGLSFQANLIGFISGNILGSSVSAIGITGTTPGLWA